MSILYIVATPIGNLEDISLRALRILKEVDLIVCEDTRQTTKLLTHYDIKKPLVSYFQHSKLSKIDYIADQLAEGKNIALVTDAGTPGISDPGGKLIEELLKLFPERGAASDESKGRAAKFSPSLRQAQGKLISGNKISPFKIIPIPGSNAAITALSISGMRADKFIFMGFPPHKKGRQKFFEEVAQAKHTVIFYESTHRILKTLRQLIETQKLTDRKIIVCRELTKKFETIYRGCVEEVEKIISANNEDAKGEFVIIVGGRNKNRRDINN